MSQQHFREEIQSRLESEKINLRKARSFQKEE
jgi:hypothetical protein